MLVAMHWMVLKEQGIAEATRNYVQSNTPIFPAAYNRL